MENGNKPAYPIVDDMGSCTYLENIDFNKAASGFSKREAMAMAAMQGLCTATDKDGNWTADATIASDIAINAVKIADALLKALEETK